jgi:mannose-6-phosphate isomerase-like protein (cupin superfamily)
MKENRMAEIVVVTPDQIHLRPGTGANVKGLNVMHVREGKPYITVIESPPNTHAQVHSHSEDEVMVVVKGRMMFIGRWCEVGSVIFVPANEEYWYSTGEEACRVTLMRVNGRGTFRHGLEAMAAGIATPIEAVGGDDA